MRREGGRSVVTTVRGWRDVGRAGEIVGTVVVAGLLALGLVLDGPWVALIGPLVLLAGAGTMEYVLRAGVEARGQPAPVFDRVTFYPLPALLGLATLVLMRQPLFDGVVVPPLVARGLIWLLGVGLISYTFTAERDSYLLRPPPTSAARFVLLTLVVVAAFVLFGNLYGTKQELLAGIGVGLVAGVLALELYRTEPTETARTWQLAAVTGLVMAQCGWALAYLSFDAVRGGAVLILIYYVLTGLAQYADARALTRRVALEYAGIGLVGLVFVLANSGA